MADDWKFINNFMSSVFQNKCEFIIVSNNVSNILKRKEFMFHGKCFNVVFCCCILHENKDNHEYR